MQPSLVLLFLFTIAAYVQVSAQQPKWTIQNTPLINVSTNLWGVFFEEINHAGEGGLHQEQISNANFETLKDDYAPWDYFPAMSTSGIDVYMGLSQDKPLNMHNPTSLRVASHAPNGNGVVSFFNPGYWGISTIGRNSFDVSFYAQSQTIQYVNVSLMDNTTLQVFATQSVNIGQEWKKVQTTFDVTNIYDPTAVFVVSYMTTQETDEIYFDVFSLMPTNGWNGLQYIRPELSSMVQDLMPSFIRFPGGCYVEGDRLSDRFNWKNTVGPIENRTGHWNLWGYYSEDRLGILEYFEWAEKFTDIYGNPSRLIWVINTGVAHTDSIPTNHLSQWVQDALDSVEFAIGDASTKWGSVRAAMGHPAPFRLDYLAIGNEDCGKPFYNENYQLMYNVLTERYPQITYIANCNLTGTATTDLFDYHVYPTTEWFYENQNFFDGASRSGPTVFNSEYAVQRDSGRGNLQAALGEAVWMTGLERNSDLVIAASYAPLFANWNDYTANPDAINFNSYQTFGSVSYYVQKLFSNSFAGLASGSVQTLSNNIVGTNNVSVSVTKGISTTMSNTEVVVIKIACYNYVGTSINVNLEGFSGTVAATGDFSVIASPTSNLMDENSFQDPTRVSIQTSTIKTGSSFDIQVPSYSILSVRVYITGSQIAAF
jgi:alpha-N-arabinofuranosidase